MGDCDANKHQDENDEDSVISDSCWKETYKGASRKWLIRDNPKHTLLGIASTMKDEYRFPEELPGTAIGRRKAILLRKFYDEVTQEIIEERNKKPEVEEYRSSYYNDYGYLALPCPKKDPEKSEELYNKYPLYGSEVMSYWKHQWDNRRESFSKAPPNLTAVLDLKKPFKRNSTFTTPICELLDLPDSL